LPLLLPLPLPLPLPLLLPLHLLFLLSSRRDLLSPLLLSLPVFLSPKPKNRHFDRSASQSHREARSGEICCST
jgi:hypothetical protein